MRFTWLPIGDVGYRLNLLSAVARRDRQLFPLPHRRSAEPRAVARPGHGVRVAASYYVWTACVAAELYAPAWLRRRRPDRPRRCAGGRRAEPALFASSALLAGTRARRARVAGADAARPGPARAGAAVAGRDRASPAAARRRCGVIGAAVYGYLPLRAIAAPPLDPARDYWQVDLSSWQGFWWMVSGAGFRRNFFAVPRRRRSQPSWRRSHSACGATSSACRLLGGVGLAVGLRRRALGPPGRTR